MISLKNLGTLCLVAFLACSAQLASANAVSDEKPREVGMYWEATGVDPLAAPFSFTGTPSLNSISM